MAHLVPQIHRPYLSVNSILFSTIYISYRDHHFLINTSYVSHLVRRYGNIPPSTSE